jgi:hypothetical protein
VPRPFPFSRKIVLLPASSDEEPRQTEHFRHRWMMDMYVTLDSQLAIWGGICRDNWSAINPSQAMLSVSHGQVSQG